MKGFLFLFFIHVSNIVLSQQVLIHAFETEAKEIILDTFGLDGITIVNTNSNKLEVSLFDEEPNSHTITKEEEFGIVKIGFKSEFIEESGVFRKFITKRL